MATIKNFTSLEQSKKLTKILPIESADHFHIIGHLHTDGPRYEVIRPRNEVVETDKYWPCWSLAALYNILPNTEHISTTLSRGGWKIEQTEYVDKWWCEYEDDNDHTRDVTVTADNPIDACVEMIEKLNELKML